MREWCLLSVFSENLNSSDERRICARLYTEQRVNQMSVIMSTPQRVERTKQRVGRTKQRVGRKCFMIARGS